MATTLAADNGYNATTDSKVTITTTYPVNGNASLYQVHVSRIEPIFFGAIYGHPSATVEATSTATFEGNLPQSIDPSGFGRIDQTFNYASYGPDNGADRGDDIDTRWNSISSGPLVANPLFGENSGGKIAAGPADYPYGQVFSFNIPHTYAAAMGTSKVDFEIYDPDTYDNGVDAHGTYDEMDKAPSGSTSNNEDWLYTLWKGGQPGDPDANPTIVAQAVYGEDAANATDEKNTNDHWVTPNSGFIYDTSSDFAAAPNSTQTYYLSVQTTDDKPVNGVYATGYNATSTTYGTGYDENGYLIRAGAPHPADNTLSITQKTSSAALTATTANPTPATRTDLMDPYATDPTTKETYDALWASTYGAGVSGITAATITPSSVNDNGTGSTAIPIYFGFAPTLANAVVTITFNGWDEDSGASAITYTCDAPSMAGQVFTGTIGGNAAWSTDKFTFPANTYPGGNWTAHYTTGASDNTTWKWADTAATLGSASVHLTYTSSNVF
jgi:hypothetical protein